MLEGDLEFFQELFESQRSALLRFAKRQVGDSISEDLVEETFLVAWCKLDTLRAHPMPKQWLFRVLYYRCKREVARKSYQSEISTDMDTLYIPSGTPEHGLLEILPANLPQSDRDILIYRFRDEMEIAEIAELLGIREDAARKRVARAVIKCRKLLLEPAF